jgi:predicted TIM-barrel fold metal-dependent hydrolase
MVVDSVKPLVDHQFRIFDAHSHVNEALFRRPLAAGGYDVADDVVYRRGVMARARVRACVLMANHIYERPEGIADTRKMNDFVAWYRDTHRDLFPVAIGGIEPKYGVSVGVAEIHRMATELHLDGVVWHHHFHGTEIDEPRMFAYVEALAQHHLPALLHFNGDSRHESPAALEPLAVRFPEVAFVALSAMNQGNFLYDMRRIAERCPNVVFDTSFVRPIGRVIESFAAAFGAERLMYGSDLVPYAHAIYRIPPAIVDIVESDRLSEEQKRQILWGTAERLFPALRALS